MQASEILDRVAEILQDVGGLTWTSEQALSWLNDSQRVVVNVRPDSSSLVTNVTCVAGTSQTIPANGERLLAVTRNMGADGSTPGRAIKKVDRDVLDENSPDWHSATAQAEAKGYVYDSEKQPKVFYLTPPIQASQKVEVMISTTPTDCVAPTSDIDLPDMYAPAMIEWCLYRSFARDAPETPNWQRADRHFKNFFSILGVKSQSDLAVKPSSRSRNN